MMMTPERLAEIRRRSTAAVQAYRFGTTGTTPMDVDGLTINEAIDIVAESAKDVPALLAEVDRLRAIEAGVEALADEWRYSLNPPAGAGMEAFVVSEWAGCLRANLPALDALLNPTEGGTP